MPPLADAGPGPLLVLVGGGFVAVAGLMLFSGLVLLGLRLARRRAEQDEPPPGPGTD